MRILSGVQPSGKLHLGNYFGAIRQFVELQHEGEALYFIADLHALTTRARRRAGLRELTREAALAFLALGLDPKQGDPLPPERRPRGHRAVLDPGHGDADGATSSAPTATRTRSPAGISPDFGLFAYPVLMAADILLYGIGRGAGGQGPDAAPRVRPRLGDQVQRHLRAGLRPAGSRRGKEGHRPGSSSCPRPRSRSRPRWCRALDGQKMSKSYGNTIDLFGDDKETQEADHGHQDRLHPGRGAQAPGEQRALRRCSSCWRRAGEFAGARRARGGRAARATASTRRSCSRPSTRTFDPARSRREELLADPGEVDRILADGARRARELAHPVISGVRKAVGLPVR